MPRLFLVHNSLSAAVREDTFDGRPFLVAPVIAVKAGVLNGELLTADAINHVAKAWNGRPVVLTHPVNDKGAPISANEKLVLESMAFGMLLNCEFKDNGLFGEIWIDLGKTEHLGGDALLCVERLRTQQPIEVSTGYWCDPKPKSGTFNGKKYTAVQHNLHPDHLALLPHDLGACSWPDGCGVPRVNVACTCHSQEKEQGQAVKNNWLTKFFRLFRGAARHEEPTDNITQSFSDVEDALYAALAETLDNNWDSYAYIADVYKTYFVYCVNTPEGMGPYYWRDYSMDANGVATLGEPEEVVREVRYTPMKPTANAELDPPAPADDLPPEPEPTAQQQQGDDMEKKHVVAAILKANGMDPAAEAGLLLLPDDQLQKLMPVAEEPKKEEPTQQAAQPAVNADTQEVLSEVALIGKKQREDLTAVIVANSGITAEECAGMSLGALKKLAPAVCPTIDYSAQGYATRTTTNEKKKPLAPEPRPVYEYGAGFVKNGQVYLKGIQADVQE